MGPLPQQYKEAQELMKTFTDVLRQRDDFSNRPIIELHFTKGERLRDRLRAIHARARDGRRQREELTSRLRVLQRKALEKVEAAFTHTLYVESAYGEKDRDGTYRISTDELDRELKACQQNLCMIPKDLLFYFRIEEKFAHLYQRWEVVVTHYMGLLKGELQGRVNLEPEPLPSLPDPIHETRNRIRQRLETLTKLTHDCEQQIQEYPQYEAAIRTVYGKAMDRLKETA